MAVLGCTVHGYDPFDVEYDQKNGSLHIHKLAITDQDDEFNEENPSLTFESILKRNGDENKTITYVKFDIEICLKAFGYPDNFIEYVHLIFNSTESAVLNNGYTTSYFLLERGVRQGCPLFALLFVIAVETLANAIRFNKHIKGCSIGNVETKILQYADDITIIVQDIHSLQLCLNIMNMLIILVNNGEIIEMFK